MDDIWKNNDFSRKNKVFFNTKSPYVPSFSWFPPYVSSISKRFFSSIFQTFFGFFCEKIKNHILYKTHKIKHFRIKFPICTCHFGNIKKTPFITIMENTFFFRTFRKCTYRKNQTKNMFHLNNGENDYFSISISRKSLKIFNFTLWSRDCIYQVFEAFWHCGHDPPLTLPR